MRSGSEPLHLIDLRDMLDARAQCMSWRLRVGPARDDPALKPNSRDTAVCRPNGNPRRHRTPVPRAMTHHFQALRGLPASLGPGLRTASGAPGGALVSRHRVSITQMSEEQRQNRKMFATVVAMSKFTGLEERIAELKEQFHAPTGSARSVA
jgi:hypothetical protein